MNRVVALMLLLVTASCEDDTVVVEPTPIAPAVLIASPHSEGIALAWADKSENETEFQLEYAIETGDYSLLATLPANTTTFTHKNLTAPLYHKYRIRACNAVGCSDWSNESGRRAQYRPTPPEIVLLRSFSVVTDQAILGADFHTGALQTMFSVQHVRAGESFANALTTEAIAVEPSFNAEGVLGTSSGSGRVFNLSPGTTYSFRAIVRNALGVDTSHVETFTTRTN